MDESGHSSRREVPDRSSGIGRGAGLTCSDLGGREPEENTPLGEEDHALGTENPPPSALSSPEGPSIG